MIVECVICGRHICMDCDGDKVCWFGDTLCCSERCCYKAKEDAEANGQEANNEARREATGAIW